MALEIERKFLVTDESYKAMAESATEIVQGYLSDHPDRTVRVRIYGDCGYITVKSRNEGAVRNEWEYEIPVEDVRRMLDLPGVRSLSKIRYLVKVNGDVWEVDEFKGRHEGLVLAEIELDSADRDFTLPPFVGKEVTGDSRYYNSVLVSAD